MKTLEFVGNILFLAACIAALALYLVATPDSLNGCGEDTEAAIYGN